MTSAALTEEQAERLENAFAALEEAVAETVAELGLPENSTITTIDTFNGVLEYDSEGGDG